MSQSHRSIQEPQNAKRFYELNSKDLQLLNILKFWASKKVY